MAAEWHGMEHGAIAQLRVSGVEKKLWTSTSQRQGHAQVVGWNDQKGGKYVLNPTTMGKDEFVEHESYMAHI